MPLALLVALRQQPATPGSFPVTTVEITPAVAAVEVGQKVQLAARALDATGQPVRDAVVRWFAASDAGSVDSTGLVTGGYAGVVRVAAVATLAGRDGQKIDFALVHVLPESPARILIDPAPATVMAGTSRTLAGTAYSQHGDRRADLVSFASSNPRVATVTPDGRLSSIASGRATITAKAGGAASQLSVHVVANTVAKLSIEPGSGSVRTGDVMRFGVIVRDRGGRALLGLPVEWAVAATGGGASRRSIPAARSSPRPPAFTR